MKRYRSRAFWQQTVAELEASNKTLRQAARDLGVSRSTLDYWVYKFRKEQAQEQEQEQKEPPPFVPVRLIAPQIDTAQRELELEVASDSLKALAPSISQSSSKRSPHAEFTRKSSGVSLAEAGRYVQGIQWPGRPRAQKSRCF